VGFVVDKVALGQVFSEYFGFPCQSFHQFLHNHYHYHPGLVQQASSGRSTQSLTPVIKKIKIRSDCFVLRYTIHVIVTFLFTDLNNGIFCSSHYILLIIKMTGE
jgi:hypothetical protein